MVTSFQLSSSIIQHRCKCDFILSIGKRYLPDADVSSFICYAWTKSASMNQHVSLLSLDFCTLYSWIKKNRKIDRSQPSMRPCMTRLGCLSLNRWIWTSLLFFILSNPGCSFLTSIQICIVRAMNQKNIRLSFKMMKYKHSGIFTFLLDWKDSLSVMNCRP